MASIPFDQVSRRILHHLASRADVDAQAVAQAVGVSEEVARSRLAAMAKAGLLGGVEVRLPADLAARTSEHLVSGIPGGATDRRAIERLCGAPGVTRVFGLAAPHSIAFTLQSGDAAEGRERALALAREAGLSQPTAVLVLSTLQDRRLLPLEFLADGKAALVGAVPVSGASPSAPLAHAEAPAAGALPI